MGGGKSSTTTQKVSIPPEVLARYNSVNATAEQAAKAPFQIYSNDPSAFVAPLNTTQQAGIQNTNSAAGLAQPYYQQATQMLGQSQNYAMPFYDWASATTGQAQSIGDLLAQQAYGAMQTGQDQGSPYNTAAGSSYNAAYGSAQPFNMAAAQGISSAYNGAQPYNMAATGLAAAGAMPVDPSALDGNAIGRYMTPYLQTVLGSTANMLNQNNQQQQMGQLGNAIRQGGFGGDRAGLAAANLQQQQNLANSQIYSGIANQAYGQALDTAQQQQALGLSAGQANRQALQNAVMQMLGIGQQGFGQGMTAAEQTAGLGNQVYNQGMGYGQAQQGLGSQVFGQGMTMSQLLAALGSQQFGQGMTAAQMQQALGQGIYGMGSNTAQQLAALGSGAQGAALQGAQAQLAAGQTQQQTEQAGLQALYNQFLQQQSYPYQVAQFLANIAMGTGALTGSTTTTSQPGGFFSDRRLKEDVKPVGKTFDGQTIYSYRYKGDPRTQVGLIAQEVEHHHPDAVGSSHGYRTVDYGKATEDAAERGHFAFGGAPAMSGAGGLAGAAQQFGNSVANAGQSMVSAIPNLSSVASNPSAMTGQMGQAQQQFGNALGQYQQQFGDALGQYQSAISDYTNQFLPGAGMPQQMPQPPQMPQFPQMPSGGGGLAGIGGNNFQMPQRWQQFLSQNGGMPPQGGPYPWGRGFAPGRGRFASGGASFRDPWEDSHDRPRTLEEAIAEVRNAPRVAYAEGGGAPKGLMATLTGSDLARMPPPANDTGGLSGGLGGFVPPEMVMASPGPIDFSFRPPPRAPLNAPVPPAPPSSPPFAYDQPDTLVGAFRNIFHRLSPQGGHADGGRAGYAGGGSTLYPAGANPIDIAALLEAQQKSFGPFGNVGIYGAQPSAAPRGGSSYVPNTTLPVSNLVVAGELPDAPQSGMSQVQQALDLAKTAKGAYSKVAGAREAGHLKSFSRDIKGSFEDELEDEKQREQWRGGRLARAVGGMLPAEISEEKPYDEKGFGLGLHIPDKKSKLKLPTPPPPPGQSGGGLGDILGMAGTIASFFSDGGAVEPHGLAAGGRAGYAPGGGIIRDIWDMLTAPDRAVQSNIRAGEPSQYAGVGSTADIPLPPPATRPQLPASVSVALPPPAARPRPASVEVPLPPPAARLTGLAAPTAYPDGHARTAALNTGQLPSANPMTGLAGGGLGPMNPQEGVTSPVEQAVIQSGLPTTASGLSAAASTDPVQADIADIVAGRASTPAAGIAGGAPAAVGATSATSATPAAPVPAAGLAAAAAPEARSAPGERHGLMDRIFHPGDRPDLLLPLLKGIATMGTAPTRHLGVALAAGLGAGTDAYLTNQQQRAEIERTKAETEATGAQAEQTRAITYKAFHAPPTDDANWTLVEGDNPDGETMLKDGKPVYWKWSLAMADLSPRGAAAGTPGAAPLPNAAPPSAVPLGAAGQQLASNAVRNFVTATPELKALSAQQQANIVEQYRVSEETRPQLNKLATIVSRPDTGVLAPNFITPFITPVISAYNNVLARVLPGGTSNPVYQQLAADPATMTSNQILEKMNRSLAAQGVDAAGQQALGALEQRMAAAAGMGHDRATNISIMASMYQANQMPWLQGKYLEEIDRRTRMPGRTLARDAISAFNQDYNTAHFEKDRHVIEGLLDRGYRMGGQSVPFARLEQMIEAGGEDRKAAERLLDAAGGYRGFHTYFTGAGNG